MGPVAEPWQVANPLPREQWTGKEIVGLRAWRLGRWPYDDTIRLGSLSRSDVWHGPVFRADVRPGVRNRSGVYALKPAFRPRDGQEYDWLSGSTVCVWGWVALSGHVIEHTRGYRAEVAVIRRLRLGVRALLRLRYECEVELLRDILEERYQCPVKIGHAEPRKASLIRSGLESLGFTSIPVLPAAMPHPGKSAAKPAHGPAVRRDPPRTPRMRKKQPVGTSAHGLEFGAVVRAFQAAERELGTQWRLTGEEHCRRVTLDGRYSRHVRPVTKSWEMIFRGFPGSKVAMFPLPIVVRAAEFLKAKPETLIGSEY